MTKEEMLGIVRNELLTNFIKYEMDFTGFEEITDRKEMLVELLKRFVAAAKAEGLNFRYQSFAEYEALQTVYTDEELTELGLPPLVLTKEQQEREDYIRNYLKNFKREDL